MSEQRKDGWQDIASAPKDGTWVLIGDFKDRDAREHSQGVSRFDEGRWYDGFSPKWIWEGAFAPTHWQPLPTPPAKGD